MKYSIVWTKRAIGNLQAIYDYIYEDSPVQAEKVVNELINCVEPLMNFPKIGVVVKEFPQQELREIIKYSYRIVYRVSGKEIQIITVIHSRQDFKSAYFKH